MVRYFVVATRQCHSLLFKTAYQQLTAGPTATDLSKPCFDESAPDSQLFRCRLFDRREQICIKITTLSSDRYPIQIARF